jgi:hypothetical protein
MATKTKIFSGLALTAATLFVVPLSSEEASAGGGHGGGGMRSFSVVRTSPVVISRVRTTTATAIHKQSSTTTLSRRKLTSTTVGTRNTTKFVNKYQLGTKTSKLRTTEDGGTGSTGTGSVGSQGNGNQSGSNPNGGATYTIPKDNIPVVGKVDASPGNGNPSNGNPAGTVVVRDHRDGNNGTVVVRDHRDGANGNQASGNQGNGSKVCSPPLINCVSGSGPSTQGSGDQVKNKPGGDVHDDGKGKWLPNSGSDNGGATWHQPKGDIKSVGAKLDSKDQGTSKDSGTGDKGNPSSVEAGGHRYDWISGRDVSGKGWVPGHWERANQGNGGDKGNTGDQGNGGSTIPPPNAIHPIIGTIPSNGQGGTIEKEKHPFLPSLSAGMGAAPASAAVAVDPAGCVYERSVRKLPGGGLQRVIVKICPDA